MSPTDPALEAALAAARAHLPPAPAPPADTRPAIVVTEEEAHVSDQAVRALATDPDLYTRANALVTVLPVPPRRPGQQPGPVDRVAGTPRIYAVQTPNLRERLTRVATWWHPVETRGQRSLERAHPPAWCPAAVAARGTWPDLRPLVAVVETPVLRPDGTLLDRTGYDASSGLVYAPSAAYGPVAQHPSRDAAKHTAAALLELVADFPFVGPAHAAAWLAALLTPLARFAFDGAAPLFLIEASTAGSGKSLLCDVIAVVVSGRPMARTSYPDDPAELRKAITAIALAGDRLVLLDNIAGDFRSPALEAALTGTTWKERILGRSEMSAELPLLCVWYATSNNCELKGDLVRRVVPVRLEPRTESPEARSGWKIPNLLAHCEAARGRLVPQALTVLRAYAAAGRPDQQLPPLGSYEEWSQVVRSAVHWATGQDPCATRAALGQFDQVRHHLGLLLDGWAELPQATTVGVTARECIRYLDGEPCEYQALRDALAEWSRDGKLPTARVVGNRLRALRGRVVGGRRLEGSLDGHSEVMRWRVVSDGGPPVAGSAGSAGSLSSPSRVNTPAPAKE